MVKYKVKIRWPCDCFCHFNQTSDTCPICSLDAHNTWDAQGEAPVGIPYSYIDSIEGGGKVEISFYEDETTTRTHTLEEDEIEFFKRAFKLLKEEKEKNG